MNDPNDPLGLLGTTVADKYAIEAIAGEGGFSTVYRAQHLIWKQPVAIKFFKVLEDANPNMREKLLEDFVQEGKLMSELSSKSAAIVQARDIGKLALPGGGWIPYMVLEWLDGLPLDILLRREKNQKLPPRNLAQALQLLDAAAIALDVAHKKGVAHRDLKPANIMIMGDARGEEVTVKLLDFGIAKVMADHEQLQQQLQMTGHEITAFTPNHGAPEQFSRNYGATGPWTDVYALALILVEIMRGGQRALDGDTFFELGVSSCDPNRRPTPASFGLQVTPAVEAIFAKALTVDPKGRFPAAGAFWRELHRAVFPDSDTWNAGRNTTTGDHPTEMMPTGMVPGRSAPSASVPGVADALTHDRTPSTLAGTVPPPGRSNRVLLGALTGAVLMGGGGIGAYYATRSDDGRTDDAVSSASAPKPAATATESATPTGPDAIAWDGPCPKRMKAVIGGKYEMGSDEPGFPLWKPAHEVTLDSFCLDVHEVTVAEYDACVAEGGCKPADETPDFPASKGDDVKTHEQKLAAYGELCNAGQKGRADHPINCVDWYRAEAYCKHYGLRLPTEAEWELAARGTDGRKFPWGNDAGDHTYMNAGGPEWKSWKEAHDMEAPGPLMYDTSDGYEGTAPVGKFPRAQTQSGQMDMVGNVWEWTADWYALYENAPATNPKGPAVGDRKAIRGGGFNGVFQNWLRPAARYHQLATASVHAIGFRCAADVKEAE